MREKILSAKTKKRIVEFPEKNDDRLVKSGKMTILNFRQKNTTFDQFEENAQDATENGEMSGDFTYDMHQKKKKNFLHNAKNKA